MSGFAIAGYEVRRLVRDRAVFVLLMLLSGLSGYAAWNGAEWVQKRETAFELIKTENQAGLADRRQFVVDSYPSVLLPLTRLVLPLGAMAPLSIGQADTYPFIADPNPIGDYSYLFRRVWADVGSPAVRAAGRFDLAFVIVFLLPLVILAAAYDLWSRERERGVAAMVLSQPVAIEPLIAMKVLARGLVVVLPSTVIILAVAVWAGAREPIGIAALTLIVLAYGGFWLAVAVIISFVARRSTEAAIAAGAVWLFVVVMAPSLSLAAVDLVLPAPSDMRFSTDLKARTDAITKRQRRYREANPAPVRTLAPRIPDSLRGYYADLVALDGEISPMIVAHREAKDARRHVLDTVRFFLPSVAVQDALDRIAGSDADRALAFETQARAAQRELRLLYKSYLDRDTPITPAEYDKVPGFAFHESGGALQWGVLADLAAVLIATILILIAAHSLRGRAAML